MWTNTILQSANTINTEVKPLGICRDDVDDDEDDMETEGGPANLYQCTLGKGGVLASMLWEDWQEVFNVQGGLAKHWDTLEVCRI